MKHLLLFFAFLLALSACTNPDQQRAVACIKPHLKCSSTMKVVNFSSRHVEADTVIDTTYHIRSINGSRDRWGDVYAEYRLKKVITDSIRVNTKIYPAHKHCVVEFDAQNLMGAMVRNSEGVVIYGDETMTFDAWCARCNYRAKDTTIAVRHEFEYPKLLLVPSVLVGDWVKFK